jgi:hypothetical protein
MSCKLLPPSEFIWLSRHPAESFHIRTDVEPPVAHVATYWCCVAAGLFGDPPNYTLWKPVFSDATLAAARIEELEWAKTVAGYNGRGKISVRLACLHIKKNAGPQPGGSRMDL